MLKKSTTVSVGGVRTITNNTSFVFNVKDYGAKGDNSTDDTAAVVNCFAAAKAAYGSTMFFPAGTYIVSQLNLDNTYPMKIIGEYTSGNPRPTTWTSKIKQKASTSGSLFRGNTTGAYNMEIRYLEFDGNRLQQTVANNAISLGGHDVYVGQCYIHDVGMVGTGYVDGSAFMMGKIGAVNSYNGFMEDCTIERCGNGWQPLDGTHHCIIRNTYVNGDFTELNNTDPRPPHFLQSEQISLYKNVSYIEVYDCYLTDCYTAIQLDAASHCIIQNCTIYNSYGSLNIINPSQPEWDSTHDNLVTGCTIEYGPGWDCFDTYFRTHMLTSQDLCTGTRIENCHFIGMNSNFTNFFPLQLSNACTVDRCHIDSCQPVNFNSDNIVFTNNLIENAVANGIRINPQKNISGLTFIGNTFRNCQRAGFLSSNSGYSVSNMVLTNNTAYNNGQSVANTYSGFQFSNPVTNLVMKANRAYDNQATKTQKRGVEIASGSTGSYDTYNLMTGNLQSESWAEIKPTQAIPNGIVSQARIVAPTHIGPGIPVQSTVSTITIVALPRIPEVLPLVGGFNPQDGSWYWVTTNFYGGPGGADGNGSTDDTTAIQNVVNAATTAGKGTYFPAGTYKITNTITLPTNANLRGYDQTSSVCYMPSRYPLSLIWMFNATDKSNITMKHMGFKTDNIIVPGVSAYKSGVGAIRCAGNTNVTFDYLRFDEVFYALSTGTHTSIASNYVWSNITCWHCYSPIKLDDLNGGTFTNWNIDAIPMSETNSQQWHCMYLERNCTNLTFTNTTWTRASGYCIHMYNSAGGTGSHDITFTNTTIDARNGRCCATIQTSGGVNPYYNIYFNGLTIPGQLAANESQALFIMDGSSSCNISGLDAYGYRLVYAGNGSLIGSFQGTMIGATSPAWTWGGLDFTYEAIPLRPSSGTYPVGSPLPGAEN